MLTQLFTIRFSFFLFTSFFIANFVGCDSTTEVSETVERFFKLVAEKKDDEAFKLLSPQLQDEIKHHPAGFRASLEFSINAFTENRGTIEILDESRRQSDAHVKCIITRSDGTKIEKRISLEQNEDDGIWYIIKK
ncbi:MAG: hypothetical protein FJ218_01505 [Ignavibacteria bacterium]|nr:hypothetical protein [Ignavibacteria bacterium]